MKFTMKSGLRRAALVAACLLPVAGAAEESGFDRLFVIGDSLSDGGAYSQAIIAQSRGALPNIRYRFTTNAPDGSARTWAEALAAALGLTLDPNIINGVPAAAGTPLANDVNVGGTNFAQGGARAVIQPGRGNNPAGGITTVPLRQQIDRLLAASPELNASDLVLIWGGANDLFEQSTAVSAGATTTAAAAANMAAAAQGLAADVARLAAAGAETIMVVTVPDIATTPQGLQATAANPLAGALLTGLGNAFNNTLIGALRGQNALIVNSQRVLSAVQADPARYGFSAEDAATVPACQGSALSCLQGVNARPDSEQRIFADAVHPTAAAHALFGQASLATLQAAPQVRALPVATMTALRQQSLILEGRLTPAVLFRRDDQGGQKRRAVGDVDYFLGIGGGGYDVNAHQLAPSLDSTTYMLRAGADVVVTPNATIGLSLSLNHDKVDFGARRGGFNSRLFLGTLFGQMALTENFYFNAAVGGAPIEVYKIQRSFELGPATERYEASSDGLYFFGRAGLGAMLPVGDALRLNPYLHFTHEKVSINGFTESLGAASLVFGKVKYGAQRVTAGAAAVYSPAPDWQFTLRGQLEHDLKDGDLGVPLGSDANTLATLSAPRPDQTWGYLSLTASYALGYGMSLNLGGSTELGLDGSQGFVGTLSLKSELY